jgi:hypothetical protein
MDGYFHVGDRVVSLITHGKIKKGMKGVVYTCDGVGGDEFQTITVRFPELDPKIPFMVQTHEVETY